MAHQITYTAAYLKTLQTIAIFCCLQCTLTAAWNILIAPVSIRDSHRNSILPLANRLSVHHHNVTILMLNPRSAWSPKQPSLTKEYVEDTNIVQEKLNCELSDFALLENTVWLNSTFINEVTWTLSRSAMVGFLPFWESFMEILEVAIDQNQGSLETIANRSWDLILVDDCITPHGWLLQNMARRRGATVMSFNTMSFDEAAASARLLPTPPSYVATSMGFATYNHSLMYSRAIALWDYAQAFYYSYYLEKLVNSFSSFKKWYPNFKYSTHQKNALFAVSTYPLSFERARPLIADNIYAGSGAFHCLASEELPKEFSQFINDPKSKGTIIASFGHYISWHYAPNNTIQTLLKVFSLFPDYRIIWQFQGNNKSITEVRNIMAPSWIPQYSLLAHRKTVMFLSHCGIKSSLEAICTRVPVLAMPIFADQHRNAYTLTSQGGGETIDKMSLNVEELFGKMNKLIHDSTWYKSNLNRLASRITDGNIIDPLENGVFWIDFVMRRKKFINSWIQQKAVNYNFITFYVVDFMFAVLFIWCFILGVIFM